MLARSFQLQDALGVLELDRVLDAAPEEPGSRTRAQPIDGHQAAWRDIDNVERATGAAGVLRRPPPHLPRDLTSRDAQQIGPPPSAQGGMIAAQLLAFLEAHVSWPGINDFPTLLPDACHLIEDLQTLSARLEHRNDTQHWQHTVCADRAKGLALYLRAAVLSATADAYGPAFGTLRTCLEHVLVDHLVFSGERLIRIAENVDDATWSEWQRQRAAGERFADVVDWTRKGRTVEIVTPGIQAAQAAGEDSYTMSPHYFLLEQYHPYLGPPSAQDLFDDGLSDPEQLRTRAKQNDMLYRTYLSWSSIKKNLLINRFADDVTIKRIEVHYRFLSAFTHPLSHVTDILYGRNNFNVPSYNHYSAELALLYVAAFAVQELRNFYDFTQRHPAVDIADWATTRDRCDRVWDEISYLWYPGHRPHDYDRVHEANKQSFAGVRAGDGAGPRPRDPHSISDDEVSYYSDPMKRLVKMHTSFQELTTGIGFQSPWPREDARFR
ncbi:hypothetical protein ACQP1P_32375 [Dactylosporangium sp. CA-052675]|uniref:hypothetical protein n=1 Tax=Dactylosporangium sp. CA-052675 TaxID=3239927 RepID=UPI003D8A8DFC